MAARRSPPRRTTLRVRVARSPSRVWKLCTGSGSPSAGSVRLRAALRRTAGEGWALATGEVRCASRAAGSGSSDSIGGEAAGRGPWQIIGQNAEQYVGAHPRRAPMKHRTQLEIDGLQRAKSMLNATETFVGAHGSD